MWLMLLCGKIRTLAQTWIAPNVSRSSMSGSGEKYDTSSVPFKTLKGFFSSSFVKLCKFWSSSFSIATSETVFRLFFSWAILFLFILSSQVDFDPNYWCFLHCDSQVSLQARFAFKFVNYDVETTLSLAFLLSLFCNFPSLPHLLFILILFFLFSFAYFFLFYSCVKICQGRIKFRLCQAFFHFDYNGRVSCMRVAGVFVRGRLDSFYLPFVHCISISIVTFPVSIRKCAFEKISLEKVQHRKQQWLSWGIVLLRGLLRKWVEEHKRFWLPLRGFLRGRDEKECKSC